MTGDGAAGADGDVEGGEPGGVGPHPPPAFRRGQSECGGGAGTDGVLREQPRRVAAVRPVRPVQVGERGPRRVPRPADPRRSPAAAPPGGTPGSGRHPDLGAVVLVVPPEGRAGAESGRGGGGQWRRPGSGPLGPGGRGGEAGGVAPELRGAKLCAASPRDGAVSGRFDPPRDSWAGPAAGGSLLLRLEIDGFCLSISLETCRPNGLFPLTSLLWSGVFNLSSSRVFSVWDKSQT